METRMVRKEGSSLDFEQVSAETPRRCHHERHIHLASGLSVDTEDGGRRRVSFMSVEVEGEGTYTSRLYLSGIWRKGGVPARSPRTIRDVAREIGYDGDPEELLEPGWLGEEAEWKGSLY